MNCRSESGLVAATMKVNMRRWARKSERGWRSFGAAITFCWFLSLVIGALVGLVVGGVILLTGRLAARMYPAGGSGWRRILVPVLGSLFDRVSAMALFSIRARQRHPANQVRPVRQRRPHHGAHRGGEIFLLFGVAGQRHRARPRGTFGAGGRRHCVGGSRATWGSRPASEVAGFR